MKANNDNNGLYVDQYRVLEHPLPRAFAREIVIERSIEHNARSIKLLVGEVTRPCMTIYSAPCPVNESLSSKESFSSFDFKVIDASRDSEAT